MATLEALPYCVGFSCAMVVLVLLGQGWLDIKVDSYGVEVTRFLCLVSCSSYCLAVLCFVLQCWRPDLRSHTC
ncbi:hypothetical protein ACRRTK_023160 [Alexandromys fortis]